MEKIVKVADDQDKQLDAEVTLDVDGDGYRIVFESRGPERNVDYIPAFALVIRRLSKISAIISDAQVVSSMAAKLPEVERRLKLKNRPFPIALTPNENSEALSQLLRNAVAVVGRPSDAGGGGNPTKRVELRFSISSAPNQPIEWVEAQIIAPGSALEVAAIEGVVRPRKTSSGQGRGLDAVSRKAVELRAMDIARAQLELSWDQVQDVSAVESFDFLCSSSGCEMRVEVKGTTGGGASVILTANEVALAKASYPQVALYVVSGIILTKSGIDVVATSGELKTFEPWNVADHVLKPIAFQCFLGNPGDNS